MQSLSETLVRQVETESGHDEALGSDELETLEETEAEHAEVLEQPQLQANDSVAVAQHPLMGAMRVVKSPARFGGARSQPGNAAPAHGENTQACLEGFGFSPEQQSALRAQGVIE